MKPKRGGPIRSKKVICVETGRVFDSMTAAANYVGAAPQNISAAVRGVSGTCGGYHWEYLDEKDIPKPKTPRTVGDSINAVLREAERRTKATGKLVRYADIQKEETLRKIKEGKPCKTAQ